ncbi:MAG: proline--tRNA ligase [Candidatus Omnitrophota bacterium]|nr:proline--tRNA ligase [Candidatus Omnitrophota bacterium]
MYWTKNFIPTLKETPQDAESVSHQLMLRAGLIRMLISGVYSYLPLGLKVLNNIELIIQQEMCVAGASQLLLPALQPLELWQATGRDKDIGEVMFRFTDRKGRKICLGPTHEEVITELVKNQVSSYRQLPVVLYQIQTKFRDEIRPRFGVIRACEFIMKDAYSFDKDEEGLKKNYQLMLDAYKRIFQRCGLDFLVIAADSGLMGGSVSHEFMVPALVGEDLVMECPKCKVNKGQNSEHEEDCPKCKVVFSRINAIEVGHIFQLGTKYSVSLGAKYLDSDGKEKPMVMGCYGIGVSRLLPAIIEQCHDSDGIIWPDEVAPYRAVILPLDVTNNEIMSRSLDIYQALKKENVEVLFDDRDERAGVKFKDADLIGIPLQIIIGKEGIKNNTVELKVRKTKERIVGAKEEIIRQLIKK